MLAESWRNFFLHSIKDFNLTFGWEVHKLRNVIDFNVFFIEHELNSRLARYAANIGKPFIFILSMDRASDHIRKALEK